MATATPGYAFGTTEQVTAAKLASLAAVVVGDIVNADISSGAAIADSKLAQITTASKVSGSAITSLGNVPSGAGTIPIANLPVPSQAEAEAGLIDTKCMTPLKTAQAIASLGSSIPAWTDYSSVSTITGWSSYTGKAIFVCKLNGIVIVLVHIAGTSNSTSASITLPNTCNFISGLGVIFPLGRCQNNSGDLTAGPYGSITHGQSLANFYSSMTGSGWTASGTKVVTGVFIYSA